MPAPQPLSGTLARLSSKTFWRSEAGLAQVGPRYFKYDMDYIPIEELTAGAAK